MNHDGRQFRLAGLALATITVMTSLWTTVSSHGRLWTPPGRATMWQRGYNTPVNYDDDAMYCGGLAHEIDMGYKCGICGDPYDSNRPNEAGGRFATGTIVATYKKGQEVKLQVDLTANHKGWFEFKVCPTNDYKKKATQKCLDAHPLQLSDGSGTKLYVAKYGISMITIPVKLPEDLTCEFCVLQWHYHAGNNWSVGKDGKGCLGCGHQEEFFGCADIKIVSSLPRSDHHIPETTTKPNKIPQRATAKPTVKTDGRPSPSKTAPHDLKCVAVIKDVPDLLEWCYANCKAGYCPPSQCKCS